MYLINNNFILNSHSGLLLLEPKGFLDFLADHSSIHMHYIVCVAQNNMSTPQWGGHIIFAFSGVRRPTWFPDILGNSSYPIFTKFGMQVYWVNSLYGIAFGDDSSIANGVIATLLLLSISLVSRHFKECY